MKKYESGEPINNISSKSVKKENAKTYQKYALELSTIKTEKKKHGVHFAVYRCVKTYHTPNIVSLVAKRELGFY